jgi:hypothetical protein
MSSNKELVKDLREAQEQVAQLQAVVNAAKAVDISFQCSDDNGSYREIDADYLAALSKAIKEIASGD